MIAADALPHRDAAPTTVRTMALTKRFDGQVALHNINFEARRGECVGFVGQNGGGRTTLLRVLATLVAPSSGGVEIDGYDAVRDVSAVRGRVAFVGDELRGSGLTVREHLTWIRNARPVTDGTDRPTVDDVIQRTALRPFDIVAALSRGQRYRLALGGALMSAASVLLLDDALQALDQPARTKFVDWIRAAQTDGVTVLAAVNDESITRALCDRVLRLEGGRLA